MERELTIFQLNDSHAYFEQHPELFWQGNHAVYRPAGGYSRIGALLNQARRDMPGRVLAFDGGDTFHGTYAAVKTRGEALLPILNALHFDATTAHWEFAYGRDRVNELANRLRFPMLATNVSDSATGTLLLRPYSVTEAAGLRIGVVGMASNVADRVLPVQERGSLKFTLGERELPMIVERLRREEKVDLVVVLSHLGFPQDMKLASATSGIDIWLSAHTHNRLYQPVRVNGAVMMQSGCHGSFLGRLDVKVEDQHVIDVRHALIDVSPEIAPDQEIQRLVDEALAPHREELSQVVGHTATALNRNTILEATMDNLLLQSLTELTGLTLAFSNGWRYGAPVPPGPVTLNDLWNIIPVNPPVSTVDLTGDELWQMMEENLEHTFSANPYEQRGGYVKRSMGLTLYFKVENPFGQRIQQLFVGGEAVKPDQLYHAAYVTLQGVPAKYGSNRQNLDVRAVDALKIYLAKHDPVHAELRGSVVAV